MGRGDARTDILIVGGGTGGCAAAMAASAMGKRVILTEATDWIGGQLTSQAVPPDEHRWIEQFGCTRRYRQYRNRVRQYMKDWYPLTGEAIRDTALNPGAGLVSRLCHEPRVGLSVIEAMLASARSRGLVDLRLNRVPVASSTNGDRIESVTVRHTPSGSLETIEAPIIIDATELGDLLPLAGVEYVSGAESQADTGELHAKETVDPEDVQAITWCFPMAYDPRGNHVISKPEQWDRWRDYVPPITPAWPGKLISWSQTHPVTLNPHRSILLPDETSAGVMSLWLYRRIVAAKHYPTGHSPQEVTLVNWPQNDYLEVNIIDKPAEVVEAALHDARQLSLSLLYWLQTEAPRPDGQIGYPGLHLVPEIVGTDDGLAMAPYIRESRRIRSVFTVTEQHVGVQQRQETRAAEFPDSVGVGAYRIDLHPSTGGRNYIDIDSYPFQIPLGALIPVRVKNLLPACKNLGVTHITNGCYRLHPVEWNIGESAGALAAFCLDHSCTPAQTREDSSLLKDFQSTLVTQGIELTWPVVHAV